MVAILYALLFLLGGGLIVRLLLPRKSPLVRVWLGAALGMLLMMVLPALCAHAFDFSIKAHIAAAGVLLVLVTLAFLLRDKHDPTKMNSADWRLLAMIAAVCIPLTALSAYLQVTHMIMPAADGSYWCGQSTYGDLCMHLSFITSMQNMAFPPSYNLLYGTAMSYPYLTDSLSTSFLMLGMNIQMALVVPGTLLMALTYVGYMMLAREILGGRHKAVAVCALLFFFNGGLGFIYDFDLMGRDGFAKIREIFTGYYKTPANQPDVNLRWSNVIADLLIPQRALMGGWAMGIPALYLLISSERARSMRQTLMLALWASCLPLVHTHTFLALGLFSGGYLIGRLIENRETRESLAGGEVYVLRRPGMRQMNIPQIRMGKRSFGPWTIGPFEPKVYSVYRDGRGGILLRALVYLAIVLVLAMPQLLGNAIKQTVEGGSIRILFNWVNNNGGLKLIDGYFWFWTKNIGLPFILILLACLNAKRRGHFDILMGMVAIFVVADWIVFQPNIYDNNKLFYIWFMFAIILACDYGSIIMQRLQGLTGRNLLCALFIVASMLSGGLSIAREAVSGYQLFSRTAVAAGEWISANTENDDVFLTGQQHINPVASLAGRQILCGSDLYVFYHGLNYGEQAYDCRRFYEDPTNNADVIERYGVDYIYVSDYERADFDVDLEALSEMYALVYENPDVRIFQVKE